MSFLSNLTGIDINVGNIIDSITGKAQAEAATEAGQVQQQAALNAAAQTAQATEQQRQDLQPFTQFGQSFIDPAQQAVAQSQQLFGAGAGDAVMNNPFFQALQNQAQTNIMQNAAVRGRLGTGGTQQHLQDAASRTGFDVLNQERQANMANVGMLQGLVGQGQNAASGQASATGMGNQIQQGFATDASAAQAGGIVGAANAQSQGAANLVGLGTSLFGLPTFGGGLG